ncbi:MAG: hypothetical protein ACE5H0_08420, partial [Bacteroidota bacterium]
MRVERKIVLCWGVYLLLSFASLMLPHRPLSWIATTNNGLQVLLGLICLFTLVHEKKQTKPIFANFGVFFLYAIPGRFSSLVGTLFFPTAPFAAVYYHQYVNKVGYPLLLAFSVLYVAVDYFGPKLRIFQKYLLTTGIVLAIFIPLYHPYLVDPLHLYKTTEYVEYMQWNKVHEEAVQKLGREATDEELLQFFASTRNQPDLTQSTSWIAAQLQKYKPYLRGLNSTTLFWSPVERNRLFVSSFLLVVISLVFLFKFLRDYPHPAYVEKILQTFFVLCMFEVLHSWTYTQGTSYEVYRSIHEVGQYLTIVTL